MGREEWWRPQLVSPLVVSAGSGWPPVDGPRAGQALPTPHWAEAITLCWHSTAWRWSAVQSLSCVFCWVSWRHTCWDHGLLPPAHADSHECPVPPSCPPPITLESVHLTPALRTPPLDFPSGSCSACSVQVRLSPPLSEASLILLLAPDPWPSANSFLRPLGGTAVIGGSCCVQGCWAPGRGTTSTLVKIIWLD